MKDRGRYVHQEGMSSRQYISIDRKFVWHLSSTSISVMRTGVICEALGSCHPLFLQASKHNRHVFRLQNHCALGLTNKRRCERGMRSQQLHSLLDVKPSRSPPSFVNKSGQSAYLVTLYLSPGASERKTKYIFEFSGAWRFLLLYF